MNRGIKGKLAAFNAYQGTLSADTSSTSIDTKELDSAGFLVQVAAFTFTGVNKVALQLTESDDNSTFTDVAAVDYEGGAIKELIVAGDGAKTHAVGYLGNKRYIKLLLNVSGTVSVAVSAIGISTKPNYMPAI